eukprot:Lithocolla_globosa_v1_NODE_1615_length_2446_cov_108.467169.p2 type:complete len:115 gc:universal NODE_1615_length_2446_cov_108.467169:82-426(+)
MVLKEIMTSAKTHKGFHWSSTRKSRLSRTCSPVEMGQISRGATVADWLREDKSKPLSERHIWSRHCGGKSGKSEEKSKNSLGLKDRYSSASQINSNSLNSLVTSAWWAHLKGEM